MKVPEDLKLAISALEELLGKKRIQLKSLREKLHPWAQSKGLKITTPRNYFYITWTRAFADNQEENNENASSVELSTEQIQGVLDHVAIMAVNLATVPETNLKDAQVLTAIGNLASAITDELHTLSENSSGLSKEKFLELLQAPLQQIGLRLSEKK